MSQIERLARRIERLATPDARHRVAAGMAATAHVLYQLGYTRRTDPYGDRWKPRVKRVSWPLLEKTGQMRASGEVETISSDGFRYRIYDPKAVFHQFGTARMPARELVPKASFGLGTWGKPLALSAQTTLKGLLT